MFDLGMQELIVIFIVALIVFGPKRLPELGRTLGKGIGELKRALSGVKDQINEEVKDVKDPLLDNINTLNPLDTQDDVKKEEEKKDEDGPVNG